MITFTFAAVPREGGAMVRMYLTQRDLVGETPRENRADWQAIRDLTETKAGEEDNAAGERLLIEGEVPANATPLFIITLVTKVTKHGYVCASDYRRLDGCPTAISMEGMNILALIRHACKRSMKKTRENAANGVKARYGVDRSNRVRPSETGPSETVASETVASETVASETGED